MCRFLDCTNQVIIRDVTVHGPKVKQCSQEGCNNNYVKGGICITHGAMPKQCSHEG